MARKPRAQEVPSSPSSDEQEIPSKPPSIDPYAILSLDRSASQEQIKSAYRKAALKYHPDKARIEDKDASHIKFQEVAFAYAILSDEKRRKRYDTTGNTAESLDVNDDNFDWIDYFRERTAEIVSGEMIQKVKQEYQGSAEEREDVVQAYVDFEGDMDAIYEHVLCSNVLEDDPRFRSYIDAAIKEGAVEKHKAYTKETKQKKSKRLQKAKDEEHEAMELAGELGVKDKLFAKGKQGQKSDNDESGLMALIQQRQKDRSEIFFDRLEAKYGSQPAAKRGKRKVDEPPEEMFEINSKRSRGKK